MAPNTIKPPVGSPIAGLAKTTRPEPVKYDTVPEGFTRIDSAKTGDNLWNLAKKHGVDFNEFVQANPKIAERANKWVYPGDELLVPTKPNKGWGGAAIANAQSAKTAEGQKTAEGEKTAEGQKKPPLKQDPTLQATADVLSSKTFEGLTDDNKKVVLDAARENAKPEVLTQLTEALAAKEANVAEQKAKFVGPPEQAEAEKALRDEQTAGLLEGNTFKGLEPQHQATVKEALQDTTKPFEDVAQLTMTLAEEQAAANQAFKADFDSLNDKNKRVIADAKEAGKAPDDVRKMASTLAQDQGRTDAAEIAAHHGFTRDPDYFKPDAVKFLKGELFSSLTDGQKHDVLKEYTRTFSTIEDAQALAQTFANTNEAARTEAHNKEVEAAKAKAGQNAQEGIAWMGTDEFTRLAAGPKEAARLALAHGGTVDEAKKVAELAKDPKIVKGQHAAAKLLEELKLPVETRIPQLIPPDVARVVNSPIFAKAPRDLQEASLGQLKTFSADQVLKTMTDLVDALEKKKAKTL